MGGEGERKKREGEREGGREREKESDRDRQTDRELYSVSDLHDRAWAMACWQCCHQHTFVLKQSQTLLSYLVKSDCSHLEPEVLKYLMILTIDSVPSLKSPIICKAKR